MHLVRLLPDLTSIHALQQYTEKLDEIEHHHEHALQNQLCSTDADTIQDRQVRAFSDEEVTHECREPNDGEHEPSLNGDPHHNPPNQDSVITRKRRPDELLFAFNHPSNIQPPINLKLEFTLKLRNKYALDLKMSKQAVLGFPQCLLPDSLWNDVLLD